VDADCKLLAELIRTAQRCWQVLGLRGYARVDFRVDEHNRPWVLEVNANPCLSPDAGFVAAANRAGLSFVQIIERLLADALSNA
jgi:D-alanine-D-alanine ligase